MTDRTEKFAENMADYIETGSCWNSMTKREAVVEVLRVLTGDLGAAQSFLYAIGVDDFDLYTYDFTKGPSNVRSRNER